MMTPPHDERPFPLATALVVYALGFVALAWPWLSGAVTIPWDAKSQFFPQLSFLARSLGEGQSPFWNPYVYAGWPQIADPQSLIFSPLHFTLAFFNAAPSFRAADAVVFALLFLGGTGIILIFRERRWHMAGAVVAALAFAFGGSNASRLQHIGQIESIAYFPLALFLLMRALDSATAGRSWASGCVWGAAAGIAAGLIAVGRDQVGLLSLYVLTGYVLWHWLDGPGRRARLIASIGPLVAGAVVGALVATVPVVFTAWLATESNRPAIGFEITARGSLHPADLLMLVFADLFGAADPKILYWGPPSFPWHEALGSTDLFHAQNIGQLYAGALAVVAVLVYGIARGWLWARDIRFVTVAMTFALLYALGKYTPAFRAIYELLPGVTLYRRPADATFMFGALFAIAAGYLVHRRLTDPLMVVTRAQRMAEAAIAVLLIASALGLALAMGMLRQAAVPIVTGVVSVAFAIAVLWFARIAARRGALAAAAVLAAFSTLDLAWNNPPHESNALPPSFYEALRPDTTNETVALLKAKLAEPVAPDRRDRVELIGIGYHWPNIGLVHGFEHLFGHNPLRLRDFARATNASDTVAVPEQRQFSPLLSSYTSPLESLFGVRYIATGVPVEQIDLSLKPGDLPQIARTKDAYIYENPRALPRVMLVGNWQYANFDDMLNGGVWPNVDPGRTVLLARAPQFFIPGSDGGTARIVSYRNTEVVIETEAQTPAILVLNDMWHPWWRACIAGAEQDILKANVLFRAVAVPAGKHTVRFSFHPFAGAFGGYLGSSESRC